jgi:chromosome segregation ATPase
MNKTRMMLSTVLSLSIVTGASQFAFADSTNTSGSTTAAPAGTQTVQLTPDQQQQRDAFIKVYYNDMNQLVALRQSTEAAVKTNQGLIQQIKDKVKAKTGLNADDVSKLKDLAGQRKSLVEQAKQLQQQRLSLRAQYQDAVKAKDVNKMQSIEQQVLALNSQISDVKAKNDSIKSQVAPLRSQLQSMRNANKQLRGNVSSQMQQVKTIRATVKTQEQERAALWNAYKENIKNKDYASAEATFNQIIDKKSAILDNIKQINTVLNQILSSLNE